jgi:hypothetical protein
MYSRMHLAFLDSKDESQGKEEEQSFFSNIKPHLFLAATAAGVVGLIFLATMFLPAAPMAGALIGAGLLKLSVGASATAAAASGGVGASLLTGITGALTTAMTAFGIFAAAKKQPLAVAEQNVPYSLMK